MNHGLRLGVALLAVVAAIALSGCTPSVLTLEVGDCFDDWDDIDFSGSELVSDVPIVDCDAPHDNEVYAVEVVPGSTFPGDDAMIDLVFERCIGTFDRYVGTPYLESSLDFGWFVPTRESWDEAEDRTITCFLFDLGFQPLTGSMMGSGI